LFVPGKVLAQEAICPCCGEVCRRPADLVKEWEATPKEQRYGGCIRVFIHYWECPRCGERFRTATRIWPKDKEKTEKTEKKVKAKASAPSTGSLKLEKIRKKLMQRQTQGTTR